MKYVRILCWLLCAVCFGYNFYLWGGINDTPHVGTTLMKDAPRESFLAATYMVIGSKANGTLGQTRAAVDYVASKYPKNLLDDPTGKELLTVDKFKAAQPPFGQLSYLGAPLLLVLSFVLRWTKQKQVKSLGGSKN
jgi:hypothetical protein